MPPAKIAVSPRSMRILRASNSQGPGSRQLGPPWEAAWVTGMAAARSARRERTTALLVPCIVDDSAAVRNRQSAACSGGPTEGRPRPSRDVCRALVARGRLPGLAIRSSLASATTNVPGQEHQPAKCIKGHQSLASPGSASKPLSPGCRLLHRTAALHLHCTAALWLDAQCHTLLSAVSSARLVACHCLPSPPAF
jgi:hypothetical protein